MLDRTTRALLVAVTALLGACEYPTGPSGVDFATQSALTSLTLSRGNATLVSTRGSGEFEVTSPVDTEHRLTFHVEFPSAAPVSHQVFVNVTENVSRHSERLGTRLEFFQYKTGRGVLGDDYELSFVSGKGPGRRSIRVTVEESEGDVPGLATVAEVVIHLTLERPPSETQSDLVYLDLTAGGERRDPGSETLLVTSESGAFEITSTVDTPHTLGYSVFLAPLAPVRRTVTLTLTEDYSVAAARGYHSGSYVSEHHTGRGTSGLVRGGLTGEHFRTRSTPGVYRASFRIEESGAGLPPGRTLVDEVTIRLTLKPK